MSEHIRGSYDDALFKSTYTLLYHNVENDFKMSVVKSMDFGLCDSGSIPAIGVTNVVWQNLLPHCREGSHRHIVECTIRCRCISLLEAAYRVRSGADPEALAKGAMGDGEAQRTEAGVWFLGGSQPPPHKLVGIRSAVRSPSGARAKPQPLYILLSFEAQKCV